MSKVLPLNEKLIQIGNEFRDEIISKVQALIGTGSKKVLRFPGSVYLHFIDDNTYTDLRQISLPIDSEMLFQYERYCDGAVDDFESTLSELDSSALYEVWNALVEKNYKIVEAENS